MKVHIKSQGFTLIEVLIAIVILAVGLLGLASLQAVALKDNQDAYFRSEANFLAYEMSDRLRANATYWHDQNTDAKLLAIINAAKADTPISHPYCSISDPPSPAGAPGCTPAEQAEYDVYRWWQDIQSILPNGNIAITWRDDIRTTSGNTDVINLILAWNRSNQGVGDMPATATLNLDVRL